MDSITVPLGIFTDGSGIIGAAALSGDHPWFQSHTSADQHEPSFAVYSVDGVNIKGGQVLQAFKTGCPKGQKPGQSRPCCPYYPRSKKKSTTLCLLEIGTGIGAIFWIARGIIDYKNHPQCLAPRADDPCVCSNSNIAGYCVGYSMNYSHYHWHGGCHCPTPNADQGCPHSCIPKGKH